jgi:hypothetical protein
MFTKPRWILVSKATWIILLMFTGCQSSLQTDSSTPIPSLAKETKTFIPTYTEMIPTVTETQVVRPTPTKLPTISVGNAKDVLEEFIKENGGCELPCILGLTPGVSDPFLVEALASNFPDFLQVENPEPGYGINSVSVHPSIWNDMGGIQFTFWENWIRVGFGFDFYYEEGSIKQTMLVIQAYRDNQEELDKELIPVYADPYFESLAEKFLLHNILKTQGLPTQVFIRAFPDEPNTYHQPSIYPFSFVLYYPNYGFVIEYIVARQEEGEYYLGCASKPHIIELSTWGPDVNLTLKEAVWHFSTEVGVTRNNLSVFKPLEEATSMSIKDFYEMYKDENSEYCVQTPKNLWPHE